MSLTFDGEMNKLCSTSLRLTGLSISDAAKNNDKTLLMEKLSKGKLILSWIVLGVEKGSDTPPGNKLIRDDCIGFGLGSSKKEGQQNAAKMALISYGYLKNDQYENTDIFYPDWDKIDSSKEGGNNYIYQTSDVSKSDNSINNDNSSKSSQSTLEMLEVESDENNSHVSDLSDETDSD